MKRQIYPLNYEVLSGLHSPRLMASSSSSSFLSHPLHRSQDLKPNPNLPFLQHRSLRFSLNFSCVSGPRYRPPCLPALPTSGVSPPPPEQPSRLPPDLLQIASVSAILFLGFSVRACSATSGRFPAVVAAECRTVQEQRIQGSAKNNFVWKFLNLMGMSCKMLLRNEGYVFTLSASRSKSEKIFKICCIPAFLPGKTKKCFVYRVGLPISICFRWYVISKYRSFVSRVCSEAAIQRNCSFLAITI